MRKLAIASVFMALALANPILPGQAPQSDNPQDTTLHSQVDLVSVYFTVRDDRKHLAGELGREHFRVFEDGHEQPIKFFANHSDVVLNVGMLLDTGTNMSWILNEEADAATAFLKTVVRPKDLGFVVSYHARVDTIQLPTSDTAMLRDKIEDIRHEGSAVGHPDEMPAATMPPLPGTGTGPFGQRYNEHREAHLYDAIHASVNRYLKGEVGRKAVVIVALSDDSKSETTLEEALERLLQNDVIAYVLQIYDPPRESTRFDHCDVRHVYEKDQYGDYKLKKLAEATGGRMLEVHGLDKLEAALDEIAQELHQQYSLGYYPANQNWDGKFRKIQITAQDHGFHVFARKGYYAHQPGTQGAGGK
jgi:VWFA-related protein